MNSLQWKNWYYTLFFIVLNHTFVSLIIRLNNQKQHIMRIQYMSDLHLEFPENSMFLKQNEIPVTGEVLVLAGDIFYLKDRIAPRAKFWKWASENYRQVLIVPGNHEYYNYSDVMERGLQWKWMLRKNVGYYQNQVVSIDDTDFVLSTLWSRISPSDEYFVWKGMNDFRQIKYNGKLLQIEEYNEMHEVCISFIRKSIMGSKARHIIVVTHHLPTFQVVAPYPKGSVLNSAFASEYGNLICDNRIDAWIYGHSHTNIDSEIGGTKLLSNQMGYIFQNEHLENGFDSGKYIEIG